MLLHALSQPLRKRNCGIQNCSWKKEQKFLTAVAADAVDLARLVLQNLRETLEDLIAGLMPVSVVHFLEMIDVAHHARYRLVQPVRMLEHLVQLRLERATIIDFGEPVCK